MSQMAKARKSTHSKGKTTPARWCKANTEESKMHEIESIGPVYIRWGKKRTSNVKGKTIKKFFMHKKEKHLIWVKWTKAYADNREVQWSAEPQGIFL